MGRQVLDVLLELSKDEFWNVLDLSMGIMDRPGNNQMVSAYHLLHWFSRAQRMSIELKVLKESTKGMDLSPNMIGRPLSSTCIWGDFAVVDVGIDLLGCQICKGCSGRIAFQQPVQKKLELMHPLSTVCEGKVASEKKLTPLLCKRTEAFGDLLKMDPAVAGGIQIFNPDKVISIPSIFGVFELSQLRWREMLDLA